MKRVPVGVVVAVGMILGGGLLTLIDPPAVTAIDWTVETTLLYGYVALFGTVGAFCCYLQSLKSWGSSSWVFPSGRRSSSAPL